MLWTDCFAWNKKKKECKATINEKCDGCKFFATPKEHDEACMKSIERREALGMPMTEFDLRFLKQTGGCTCSR